MYCSGVTRACSSILRGKAQVGSRGVCAAFFTLPPSHKRSHGAVSVQGNPLETQSPGIFLEAGLKYPNSRLSEGRQVFSIDYIVTTNSEPPLSFRESFLNCSPDEFSDVS